MLFSRATLIAAKVSSTSTLLRSRGGSTSRSPARGPNIDTHYIDQLGEFELDFNGEGVCDVDHWTNQLVVIRQEVVVQSLGVWIS